VYVCMCLAEDLPSERSSTQVQNQSRHKSFMLQHPGVHFIKYFFSGQKMMGDIKFLDTLRAYDKDNIPPVNIVGSKHSNNQIMVSVQN